MSVRVLLVDDDPLVRAGLRMLLAGDAGIEIVGEASDGDAVVDMVRDTSPDVVLMDVRMPRVDGVSALRLLQEGAPYPPVLMLTTFGAETVVLDALRAGAAGFLLKHAPPEQIVAAIHAAASGDAFVSPGVLRQLIDRVATDAGATGADDADAADPLAGLSDREREVAQAVAAGLANGEIAQQLFLSVGSVKAHISNALTKLGLDNRVQLAIAAHEAARRG